VQQRIAMILEAQVRRFGDHAAADLHGQMDQMISWSSAASSSSRNYQQHVSS